jgi:GH15 family glucan-1,4-alpha-glucosidase
MKAAIDAIARRLTGERGLVYRYLTRDGLAGGEGTFLLCTFWLAQAQALAGDVEAATVTFERALDTGPRIRLLLHMAPRATRPPPSPPFRMSGTG